MRKCEIVVFSKSEVQTLREIYPAGCTIKLHKCNDETVKLKPDSLGTVVTVDDMGTVHIKWTNNEFIGLIPFVDSFEKI